MTRNTLESEGDNVSVKDKTPIKDYGGINNSFHSHYHQHFLEILLP